MRRQRVVHRRRGKSSARLVGILLHLAGEMPFEHKVRIGIGRVIEIDASRDVERAGGQHAASWRADLSCTPDREIAGARVSRSRADDDAALQHHRLRRTRTASRRSYKLKLGAVRHSAIGIDRPIRCVVAGVPRSGDITAKNHGPKNRACRQICGTCRRACRTAASTGTNYQRSNQELPWLLRHRRLQGRTSVPSHRGMNIQS